MQPCLGKHGYDNNFILWNEPGGLKVKFLCITLTQADFEHVLVCPYLALVSFWN